MADEVIRRGPSPEDVDQVLRIIAASAGCSIQSAGKVYASLADAGYAIMSPDDVAVVLERTLQLTFDRLRQSKEEENHE
jgi:hypothetical protein